MKTKTMHRWMSPLAGLALATGISGCVTTREREKEAAAPPKQVVAPKETTEERTARIQGMLDELGGRIHFDTDQAVVNPEMRDPLFRIGEALAKSPEVRVRIDAFTDSKGPARFNEHLSRLRARNVQVALVEGGAKPEQIIAFGHGERSPVANNATPQGRAENRRAEIGVESAAPPTG